MDELPLDFTCYLSQRFGVSSEQATSLLSSWLKDYEPAFFRSDEPREPGRNGSVGEAAFQQPA